MYETGKEGDKVTFIADMTTCPTIVAGVDGSELSNEALHWALCEARRRGAALRVVLAWQPRPMHLIGEDSTHELTLHSRRLAQARLTEAVSRLGTELEGVNLSTEAIEGPTAKVLGDASKTAQLLVLGSSGHGSLSRLILGSVSRKMTVESACPVVVVPSSRVRHNLRSRRKLVGPGAA